MVNLEEEAPMRITDALSIKSRSTDTVDGLPKHEGARYVSHKGVSSAHDVERGSDGNTTRRSVKHPTRYRRTAGGPEKREEEAEALLRILTAYNQANGTDFDHRTVKADDADKDVDVTARSSKSSVLLRAQVRVADDAIWGGVSAPAAKYEEMPCEDVLLLRFLDAAKSKMTRASIDLVLILDGDGLITTHGTLIRFRDEHQDDLRKIGFGQIWWSDGANPMRLFPIEDSNER